MIPLKGTWKDSPKNKQPNEFNYELVNAVISKNIGAITNEPGASSFSNEYNSLGYIMVGIFNAKYGQKIVFSITGNPNENKIGIIKADGTYLNKITADLGFNVDYPIDCESYYNYKGELNIAFTDYYNTPKLINLDNIPVNFNLNDIQLFPFFTQPQVESEVIESGGSIKSGTYYPFFSYKNEDIVTAYTKIENPIFITASLISQGFKAYTGIKANSPTNKAIKLKLKNVDTTYKKIVVGLISKIDGVMDAKIIKEVQITGDTLDLTISGAETNTIIDLAEILTPASNYNRIKHLTQVEGVLYGAGVSENSPIDFQKYACDIKLGWTSTLISPQTIDESYKVHNQNGLRKSFFHEEVYAFYARVKIKGRGFSEWFHIPGRDAIAEERSLFSSLTGNYDNEESISATAKVYQIRDTTEDGTFGFWENEDEFYPFADEYLTPTQDLRGKKVRHHRFPSIRKLADTLYASDADYGIRQLDILGVEIKEFPVLPPELEAIVEGYEIGYAKRDVNNSTILGQSLTTFMAKNVLTPTDTKIYWTGGNWHLDRYTGGSVPVRVLELQDKEVRFNSFDLMYDKPAISPSYLSTQVKMIANASNHVIRIKQLDYAWLLDYTGSDSLKLPLIEKDHYKKLTDFKYIPSHSNPNNYVNLIGEETAMGRIEVPYDPFIVYGQDTSFWGGAAGNTISSETTFLVNLMAYKTNVYNSLKDQLVVTTGKFIKPDDTDKRIFGGDSNIGIYGYVTMAQADISFYSGAMDFEQTVGSVKGIRAFMTEGYNNHLLRHSDLSDLLTRFYPNETVAKDNSWTLNMKLSDNPNKLTYNKDYTAVNDLNVGTIFDVENDFIIEDPYKIIRSKIPNKEEKIPSWKTFLANDYYIIPRDKGYITNIQGAGKDLFINCEFALLKTRGAEELATDTFKVVLGTGNIFDRPPIELVLEENGYAGCQHKFSCLLTKHGYFFVDEDKKKIFLATDTVKDITIGLEDFFRQNLKTTGDNPYRNKGYTVSWDGEFERIILASREAQFTRSFTPTRESWTSKHTYYPDILIGDRSNLYAVKNNKIYKHNDPKLRGEYYGEDGHPFIVVVIFREEGKQITLKNVTWKTNSILDGNLKKNITFNSILVWNSYQATTEKEIIPYKEDRSIVENFQISSTRRIKNEWNYNRLSNEAFVKDVTLVDDIELVEATTSKDIPFYLKKPLSDDYVAIKLLFFNQKISNLYTEIQLLDIDVNVNLVAR